MQAMLADDRSHKPGIVIALSLIGGLILAILPVPYYLELVWPQWSVLIVIYWLLIAPHRVGLVLAWTVGLLLDSLANNLLGEQALALLIIAYITLKLQQRIRLSPILQQQLVILLLIAAYQFTRFWIQGIIGAPINSWAYILPIFSSALCWPLVRLALPKSHVEADRL